MVKIVSRLQKLINQLCPNGVEYRSLGELAIDIYRGSGIKRNEVTDIGTPCVRYGEIYTTYGIWFEECVSHTIEENIVNRKYFEHGDILFAITGESVEEIAKSCAYIGNEKCLAGGDIVVLKHNQDAKYLSYALSTTEAQKQKSRGKVKSKVVHSSVPAIKEIVVPIPPLEVQREIVCILDNLAELTMQFTAKLTEELVARKKQYEFYRGKLLTFNFEIHQYQLKELVDFRNGKGHEKDIAQGGKYVVVNSKFISTNGKVRKYTNQQICPLYIDDILMVMSDLPNGRALAKCYLVEEDDKYTLNQRIGAFHIKSDVVNAKFLLYVLNRNQKLLDFDNGIDQTNLKKEDILNILIPVPPLDIQNRMVHVLDNFDAICTELNISLSIEIEVRQKQYEYYRDLLLTFVEQGSTILTDRQTDRR